MAVRKLGAALLLFMAVHGFGSGIVSASVRQEVYVTGHVQSFGGYAATEAVSFQATEPGEREIGRIVLDGVYNGPYPWIMRIYTDNLQYGGVGGAVRRPSPAGLVSDDGTTVVPLFVHSPNFGPEVWRKIPDLNEPGYLPYAPDPDPAEAAYTDCIVMGIDPRNGAWVAGPDGLLYTTDDNLLGDTTIATPFELVLRGDFTGSSVRGRYEATVYLEMVPAP